MLPHARIAHHIPGRLRIVIGAARRDLGFLATTADRIQQLAGVEWVHLSPAAGSLVIHYDENAPDIAEAVAALGTRDQLFDLRPAQPVAAPGSAAPGSNVPLGSSSGSRLARRVLDMTRGLDRNLSLASDGAMDLKSLLPMGAAIAGGLVRFRRASAPTPLWLTLTIFAFSSFEVLNRHMQARSAGLGR